MGNTLKPLGNQADFPEAEQPPSFDPNLGFPNGRKLRASKVTELEMKSANIPKYFRDYCADKYLDIMACERIHFPFYRNCRHQLHEYIKCQGEDSVLRRKEYERERRLRRRQKRKEEAMKKAAS